MCKEIIAEEAKKRALKDKYVKIKFKESLKTIYFDIRFFSAQNQRECYFGNCDKIVVNKEVLEELRTELIQKGYEVKYILGGNVLEISW